MISASIIKRAWRQVDMKLNIDGQMHLLRWRRGTFGDVVLFDERRVAVSKGVFSRDSVYGLELRTEADDLVRLLLTIDANESASDWSGEMRPRGVRLETADEQLIAFGSLGPTTRESFGDLFDRAIKALGLT